MTESDIPSGLRKAAKTLEAGQRMDVFWSSLVPKLLMLSEIALSILLVSHSNAGEERAYSMIKKSKAEFALGWFT